MLILILQPVALNGLNIMQISFRIYFIVNYILKFKPFRVDALNNAYALGFTHGYSNIATSWLFGKT
jgi:hypothetical protein